MPEFGTSNCSHIAAGMAEILEEAVENRMNLGYAQVPSFYLGRLAKHYASGKDD